MENNKAYFTQIEARVVASLMEKHLTTPKNYPLTLNSLVLACNQKSNREPVMNLTEGQVGHTVNILKERDLVGVDYGGRSNHISHRVMNSLNLDRKRQSILTVLMLRNPQTLNEIKTRTNRMVDFNDISEISSLLQEMIDSDDKVILIPKSMGAREDRYTHQLCGKIDIDHVTISATKSSNTKQTDLEQRVTILEEKIEKLMQLLN